MATFFIITLNFGGHFYAKSECSSIRDVQMVALIISEKVFAAFSFLLHVCVFATIL